MGDLITCPYNPSHQIRPSRMQYHLVKCAKHHPYADLAVCPYNATHRVPRVDETDHIRRCPDRAVVELQRYRFNEPEPGNHGNLAMPLQYGSSMIPCEGDDNDEENDIWVRPFRTTQRKYTIDTRNDETGLSLKLLHTTIDSSVSEQPKLPKRRIPSLMPTRQRASSPNFTSELSNMTSRQRSRERKAAVDARNPSNVSPYPRANSASKSREQSPSVSFAESSIAPRVPPKANLLRKLTSSKRDPNDTDPYFNVGSDISEIPKQGLKPALRRPFSTSSPVKQPSANPRGRVAYPPPPIHVGRGRGKFRHLSDDQPLNSFEKLRLRCKEMSTNNTTVSSDMWN